MHVEYTSTEFDDEEEVENDSESDCDFDDVSYLIGKIKLVNVSTVYKLFECVYL